MTSSWQCEECASIRDDEPFLIIPKDLIYYPSPDKIYHSYDVNVLGSGKYCSPQCFNCVWEWFFPEWLERDNSRDI